MSYGFDKAKKPASVPAAAAENKPLDMSGLNLKTPEVSPTQEAAAVKAGDALGFGSREPAAMPGGRTRRRKSVPSKSVLIKGPTAVMDRFVGYADATNAASYWEALDRLMKAAGR
jgi:hypothetical protein